MEAFVLSFLFILIIIGGIGILYVYQYNKLQHSKTKLDQAEVRIDEELRNKYDILVKADQLIINLLDTKSLLKDLDKLKNENISNFDLDRKLNEYFTLLNQIKNDHSVLAEDKNFKSLLSETKKVDEKLQAAKSYYNKYTSELNDLVRTFPSNFVAKLHGIGIKTFFDGKNLEDTIIDDFKL